MGDFVDCLDAKDCWASTARVKTTPSKDRGDVRNKIRHNVPHKIPGILWKKKGIQGQRQGKSIRQSISQRGPVARMQERMPEKISKATYQEHQKEQARLIVLHDRC